MKLEPVEIKCSQCGASYRISAERIPAGGASATCKKCGNAMVVMPPNSKSLSQEESRFPGAGIDNDKVHQEPVDESARNKGDNTRHPDKPSIQQLRVFVQEKWIEYYAKRFERFQRNGCSASWNWAAFWFGPLWLIYRKAYLLGALWVIPYLILNHLKLSLPLALYFGLMGNYHYYRHAKKSIRKIANPSFTMKPMEMEARLRESGSINKRVVPVSVLLMVLPILAAIAIPQFAAYRARANNAQTQAASPQNRKGDGPTRLISSVQSERSTELSYHTGMGRSYLFAGETDKAMVELNRALTLNPKDGFVHLLLGFCYLEKKDENAADKEFSLALTLGEKDSRVHSLLGHFYELQGDYENAAKAYGIAIELAPKDPEPYFRLAGLLSTHSENLARAKDLAQTCLSLNPPDEMKVKAYLILAGIAKFKQEKETYLKKALAIDPNNAPAKTLLRFAEMGEEYHANVSISDKAQNHFDKAEKFFAENRLQEAIVEYKAVIALEPKFAKGHLYLGDCFYRLEQYEEAAVHFKKATQVDPSNPQAWAFLGDAHYQMQDLKQACLCLKEAVRLDPEYHNAAEKLRQIETMLNVRASN